MKLYCVPLGFAKLQLVECVEVAELICQGHNLKLRKIKNVFDIMAKVEMEKHNSNVKTFCHLMWIIWTPSENVYLLALTKQPTHQNAGPGKIKKLLENTMHNFEPVFD